MLPGEAEACTRVTYIGENAVITGRTLDWRTPIPTNLYVYPRGVTRRSYDTDRSITWTSKYGSVVSVGYDVGVNEGMNEMGLVCNLLYLPGTFYASDDDPRPYMSTALWAAYVLDNFATTHEAVEALSADSFQINAPKMPGGSATIGTTQVANANTDGYTIGFSISTPLCVTPLLGETSYTLEDMQPICNAYTVLHGIYVAADSPIQDVDDLIAFINEKGGTLSYAGSGTGNMQHMCLEEWASQADPEGTWNLTNVRRDRGSDVRRAALRHSAGPWRQVRRGGGQRPLHHDLRRHHPPVDDRRRLLWPQLRGAGL